MGLGLAGAQGLLGAAWRGQEPVQGPKGPADVRQVVRCEPAHGLTAAPPWRAEGRLSGKGAGSGALAQGRGWHP